MEKNDKKQSNPIFIIVAFLLVIAGFILMPYFKNDQKEVTSTNKEPENTQPTKLEDNSKALSEYIKLGETVDVEFNGIKVLNTSITSDRLSIDLYSDKDINLDNCDYYIEFYKDKKTFLFRRSLKGYILANETITITIENVSVDNDTYIALSHIDDSAIPKKSFTTDESGISGFICSRGAYTYEYDFDDNYLIRAKKKYNYKTDDLEEFSNTLLKYQKEAKKINESKGLTASIAEANKEFIYTVEINYLEIKDNKIDPYFYSKDELNYIVLFKMDAEGFICL